MRQGRIHSHQAFSVEIPNLAATLQRQNTPSLCFPAPKPTSFGFRSRNPLSFYFFHPHLQNSFRPRSVTSYEGCWGGFPAPRTPQGRRCREGLGGPSVGWVLTQLNQEDPPGVECSPSHGGALKSPVRGPHPNPRGLRPDPRRPHPPAGAVGRGIGIDGATVPPEIEPRPCPAAFIKFQLSLA